MKDIVIFMTKISKNLTFWFSQNKRKLPFRETKSPYLIWVSEIIMQQTQINQGLSYYNRFVEKFPDLETLAMADEADVMKMWQGLGYYSRARNMIYASHQIINEYEGSFPENYNDLLKIKGIGKYTAAAIASIAFNEPVPVLDGNVMRLLSRLYGIKASIDSHEGQTLIRLKADEILDRKDPGEFNQAMMEFGALVCRPKNPQCINCVLKSECKAFGGNMVQELPVRSKTLIVKERFFNYLIIKTRKSNDWHFYMKRRGHSDIWKHLFEFPLIETEYSVTPELFVQSDAWNNHFSSEKIKPVRISEEYIHKLTHRKLRVRFYEIEIPKAEDYIHYAEYLLIKHEDAQNFPVSKLIENQLSRMAGINL